MLNLSEIILGEMLKVQSGVYLKTWVGQEFVISCYVARHKVIE